MTPIRPQDSWPTSGGAIVCIGGEARKKSKFGREDMVLDRLSLR